MKTVSFGGVTERVNALAEMYARAEEIGDTVQKDKALTKLVPFLSSAAHRYAEQFGNMSAAVRDEVEGQVFDRLQADLIRTVRAETTHKSNPPITNLRALLNQEARRDLRAGTPIVARDFKPTVLIQRNSAVTLIYERGALRAETHGIAKDSGTYGSSIRIENLTTKKTMVGRVIGPGLVQMNH